MKRNLLLILITTMALALAACGAPAAGTPGETNASGNASALLTSHENALAPRLMLSLGTLRLAETELAVTPGQAREMLLLWQALQSMSQSGNSAVAETEALLGQIEGLFTAEQVAAINAMKLTQADAQTWAQANNIVLGTGSAEGGMGSGQGMSPEARATRQAANGKTGIVPGENGLSGATSKAVITYLQGIQ